MSKAGLDPDDAAVKVAIRLGKEIGLLLDGHPLSVVITVLELLTEQALRGIVKEYEMDIDAVIARHVEHLRKFMSPTETEH